MDFYSAEFTNKPVTPVEHIVQASDSLTIQHGVGTGVIVQQ
jgi:hypothetical protein